MAKKLSSFGKAFKGAKDGSTFTWNGKQYKKEYASDKKSSLSGPKKGPLMADNPAKKAQKMIPMMGGLSKQSAAIKPASSSTKPRQDVEPVFKGTLGPVKRKNPDTSLMSRRTKADLDIGSRKIGAGKKGTKRYGY